MQRKEAPKPSLNEQDTIAFLQLHDIQRMDVDAWQQGMPILYVLKEPTRVGRNTKDTPKEHLASIARVDAPEILKMGGRMARQPRTGYLINTEGGQIDYFSISQDGVVAHSGTSFRPRDKGGLFVIETNIFTANDTLFPKQPIK